MTNIREKLVELLGKAIGDSVKKLSDGRDFLSLEDMADNLIDHGVTVQEKGGCDYCREDWDGYIRMNGAFSIRKSHFGEWTISAGEVKPRQIYYCPMCGRKLPQPPKGE